MKPIGSYSCLPARTDVCCQGRNEILSAHRTKQPASKKTAAPTLTGAALSGTPKAATNASIGLPSQSELRCSTLGAATTLCRRRS